MAKKLTTDEFKSRAGKTHGNKYDYSKSIYIDSKTKIIIICSDHGEFLQTPGAHLFGQGCSKCGGSLKSNTEEFIEKANQIHNYEYTYEKNRLH